MIHQPEWEALAKPRPMLVPIEPPATAPMTATPSVIPTCRLVEATAEATPAWACGMPVTAVSVIGTLTSPLPTPNST
jgi:hypothetical protein